MLEMVWEARDPVLFLYMYASTYMQLMMLCRVFVRCIQARLLTQHFSTAQHRSTALQVVHESLQVGCDQQTVLTFTFSLCGQ